MIDRFHHKHSILFTVSIMVPMFTCIIINNNIPYLSSGSTGQLVTLRRHWTLVPNLHQQFHPANWLKCASCVLEQEQVTCHLPDVYQCLCLFFDLTCIDRQYMTLRSIQRINDRKVNCCAFIVIFVDLRMTYVYLCRVPGMPSSYVIVAYWFQHEPDPSVKLNDVNHP